MMNGNFKLNGTLELKFDNLEVKIEKKATKVAESDVSEEKVSINGGIKIDGDLEVSGNINLKEEIRNAVANMITGFANKGRRGGKKHYNRYATDTRK